jgi:hypothetical protein
MAATIELVQGWPWNSPVCRKELSIVRTDPVPVAGMRVVMETYFEVKAAISFPRARNQENARCNRNATWYNAIPSSQRIWPSRNSRRRFGKRQKIMRNDFASQLQAMERASAQGELKRKAAMWSSAGSTNAKIRRAWWWLSVLLGLVVVAAYYLWRYTL